ncbi:MAG: metallophosphoesterase [Chthoniobacter sp.]|nr:metallophosphoesterase [Chthoniobacter sp.]
MGIIGGILIVLFLGNFLWWWRADRVLRRLRGSLPWRVALGVFMAGQLVGLGLVLLDRLFDLGLDRVLAGPWLTSIYLWHCLLLFPMLLLWLPYALARGIVSGVRRLLLKRDAVPAVNAPHPLTRRDFARLLGTALPALTTVGTAAIALWQIARFRIRRLTVELSALPAELDGLTIAHVTDFHVGPFTRNDVLDRIVAATNDLRADLVLFTGDLINFALSDLDAGLAALRRLRGAHGVFLCEGNHDLFADADAFRRRTKAAGLNLLVNETANLTIRGRAVQILGLRWGAAGHHAHDPASPGDEAIAGSMRDLLTQLQPGAFPILLAHHPHAFDFAENIPLTLAGHTHGGQLMVTQNLGFGPMLYHYWSGLYRLGQRALIVSNGTGNWFPLRTRAPAEIIHITLRRG